MNFAREVAQRVTMEEVVEKYTGQKPRGKMFSCPFHGEDKHPSCHLRRGNRWICYTCGKSGDAVDFVSMLYDIQPLKAAQILNCDFGTGVALNNLSAQDKNAYIRRKKEKEAKQKEQYEKWLKLSRKHREYVYAINHFAPKSLNEPIDPRYENAIKNIDYIGYILDEMEKCV